VGVFHITVSQFIDISTNYSLKLHYKLKVIVLMKDAFEQDIFQN